MLFCRRVICGTEIEALRVEVDEIQTQGGTMNFRTILNYLTVSGFLFAILLTSCGQQITGDNFDNSYVNDDANSGVFNKSESDQGTRIGVFPIHALKTFSLIPGTHLYSGGTLQMGNGNGSNFHVFDSSLTPPPGHPEGGAVTIEMTVDLDSLNKELIFTFGPSGCKFVPAARITLTYNILGVVNPVLYYIKPNGQYVRQTPDYIDIKHQFMYIYVDHFSRYAIAFSQDSQNETFE